MSIKIIQSCDEGKHVQMLDHTFVVNSSYANKYLHTYEKFIGNKIIGISGVYNILYHLKEELDSDSFDWLLWLDTDAFIVDHNIDLLSEICIPNQNYAIIGAAGNPLPNVYGHETYLCWDINSGVLFFNLKHETTRIISDEWIRLLQVDVNKLSWDGNYKDGKSVDQGYLREAIEGYWNNHQEEFVKLYDDSTNQYNYINYEGSLIRHVLDDTNEFQINNNRNGMRFTWTGYTWDQRLELVKQWTSEIN